MRGHGGQFIVEGKVTLDALIRRSRFEAESLFLTETRLAPLQYLLEDLDDAVPVYVGEQALMDEVAGFPVHRGVLACGKKGKPVEIGTVIAEAQTVLVLLGLSNHDNVGACFRNAAAFGCEAILLDAGSCDPLYRKAIRVSAGTALTLPFAHDGTEADILTQLERSGFDIWCMTPSARAVPLHGLNRPDKVAIVLGAEGPGLSNDILAKGKPVRISMTEGFDSINVATAGAIALSYLYRSPD